MQNQSDAELLREYAISRSEAAFSEMVRRYADFVYSAALRQMGDAEQARDVAQVAFATLARKAAELPPGTVLIGWLCHAARFAALEQFRKDQRRLQRERQAMDWHDSTVETADDWSEVRPVLDEAISSLGHEDRDALLLRFFKNESLASVGTTLGVSEDAAQKRVSRALAKLREFLAGRGINTTAAALSMALTTNAVQAAPGGFASALAAGALASTGSATAVPFLNWFALTNMKATLVLLTMAGGLVALTVIHLNTQRQLRDARAALEHQAAEIEALRMSGQGLASQAAELDRARSDATDVLRLRGEVARMRRELAERKAIRPLDETSLTNRLPDPVIPQIVIRAEFIAVPAAHAGGDGTGFLTEEQAKTFGQDFENLEGARVLGRPSVVTLSGNQAQVMIGQSVPFNGANTNIGLMVDVLPTYQPDASAIDLAFDAQLRRLVGDREPLMEVMSVTNSIRVPDGETLVIVRRIPSTGAWLSNDSAQEAAQPRSLIVLLTPTLIDAAGNALNVQRTNTLSSVEPVFPGVVAAHPEPH